jgi:hypothetical protein
MGEKTTLRVSIVNLTYPSRLISQYGIASTPVIALWENGMPRYRLYEDYSKLETLVKVIQLRTEFTTRKTAAGEYNSTVAEPDMTDDRQGPFRDNSSKEVFRRHHPTKEQFLDQFVYLKRNMGFDWWVRRSTRPPIKMHFQVSSNSCFGALS